MSLDPALIEPVIQRLGDALRAAAGDEMLEKAACERAVIEYRGLDDDPDALICEMLRDGDGPLEGAFERVGSSDEEYARWSAWLADAAGY